MKQVLALLITLVATIPVQAQFLTPRYSTWMCEHVVYLEVLGNGGTLSLNYEQLIASGEYAAATSRFGAGAWPRGAGDIEFGVPVTASGLFGHKKIWGEIGAGVRMNFTQDLMEQGISIWPTGILGVRLHPDHPGGIMLRLAYTPALSPDGTFVHGAGMSIGFGLSRK